MKDEQNYYDLKHLDRYRLVWHDEFEKEKLDSSLWGYRNLGDRREAINSEKSILINNNRELVVSTFKDQNGGIYSGMISTQKLF